MIQESGTRISHRETRLRKRIDDLTDQRDRALQELWDTRDLSAALTDELEQRIDRLTEKNKKLRREVERLRENA